MTSEEATLDNEELTSEERWSYYVTAYSMRDPTEGVQFSKMNMPFMKRNLPSKLEEEEEYDRYYRNLQHHDGLIIRICANNYTMLYQPPSYDWFWRSNAPIPEKDADADAIKAQLDDVAKETAAIREKRHDRFVEKFINNPSWARGLSNQRFRSWINGTLSDSPGPSGSEGTAKGDDPKEKADSNGNGDAVDANATATADANGTANGDAASSAAPADTDADAAAPTATPDAPQTQPQAEGDTEMTDAEAAEPSAETEA
jgi:paired amphipathic helix protein Sin3a